MLTELGFPLRAALLLILGNTCWEYLDDVWHRLTGKLGLGGWEGLGGFGFRLGLGRVGGACEEGGYGDEACCDYLQVVSFRLSDIYRTPKEGEGVRDVLAQWRRANDPRESLPARC